MRHSEENPAPERNTPPVELTSPALTEPTPEVATPVAPLPLPAFILPQEGELFIDRSKLGHADDFAHFVAEIFTSGHFFAGLNYVTFTNTLYGNDLALASEPERLAHAIQRFDPARRSIYKGIKLEVNNAYAEYFFEQPVYMERLEKKPRFGPSDEFGEAQIIGEQIIAHAEVSYYDIDEFIADMWLKGVKFGINIDTVSDIINNKRAERVKFAHKQAPIPAIDASLQEIFAGLHRDNSPKMLDNGRHDLRQYSNRFPQIGSNVDIFHKIPLQVSVPGFTVTGEPLVLPGAPKNFNLANLAGPGTRIERRGNEEYIVSSCEGFLDLDTRTNLVSVSETVINKEGVSLRTTGDISLAGDHFENHGDVQERRLVDGKHMTFHGDIFGQIESRGGDVKIKGNVISGSVSSRSGSIHLEGRASRAQIDARGGRVEIELAEGSRIIGKLVRIKRAVRCEIIADRVEADSLESCTIATLELKARRAGVFKNDENRFYLIKPDITHLLKQQQDTQTELDKLRVDMAGRQSNIDVIKSQPDLVKYLALNQRVKNGELKLNDQQYQQLQSAGQRFTIPLRTLRTLTNEIEQIQAAIDRRQSMLTHAQTLRASVQANLHSFIKEIVGDTNIRLMAVDYFEPPLADVQIDAIIARLQRTENQGPAIFSGHSGSFSWRGEEPVSPTV